MILYADNILTMTNKLHTCVLLTSVNKFSHTNCLNDDFLQVNMVSWLPATDSQDEWHRFLQTECPYWHLTTSIRACTHPFNSPFSGTTRVSRYQKGERLNQSGFYWSKRQRVAVTSAGGHMQVCIWLQTDNHASTQPLKFFTGWMPFLLPNQQRQSTEGTKN